MHDQLLDLLNRRIDDHERALHLRLDGLERRLHELHDTLRTQHREAEARAEAQWDAHAAYHRGNEHRWGLQRLAQRHPLRLALLTAAAVALLGAAGPAPLQRLGLALLQLAGQ